MAPTSPAPLIDLRTLVTGLLIFSAVWVAVKLYQIFTHPLHKLPGPPVPLNPAGILLGNLPAIFAAGPGELHTGWIKEYGPILAYTASFGSPRLLVTDPRALAYILQNAYDFPKPQQARNDLASILGKGVLFAEGEDHHRQRKLLNPAFGSAQISRLTPIFFENTFRLRDKWIAELSEQTHDAVVDISSWSARLTLDIIGKAGFAYNFGGLEREDNKLAGTFRGMLNMTGLRKWYTIPLFALIRVFPVMAKLPTERLKRVRALFGTMQQESQKIVDERKEALANSAADTEGRDLLTLLLKANASETAKNSMNDAEVQGQLTTFILAGHETTSTALTWTLHHLSQDQAVQDRLRRELRDAGLHPSTTPGQGASVPFEQLNSLPYLDAVTREILRMRPPVPNTIRESAHDVAVPLASPLRTDGSTSLFVPKGSTIFIPIYSINTSTELWGEDAAEFKPERWMGGQDGLPKRAREELNSYALWGSQLTFLGGQRGCVGYRFALAEFKAILAVLVTTFIFEETLKAEDFVARSAIVMRPFLKDQQEKGSQMPLKIKLAPSS